MGALFGGWGVGLSDTHVFQQRQSLGESGFNLDSEGRQSRFKLAPREGEIRTMPVAAFLGVINLYLLDRASCSELGRAKSMVYGGRFSAPLLTT